MGIFQSTALRMSTHKQKPRELGVSLHQPDFNEDAFLVLFVRQYDPVVAGIKWLVFLSSFDDLFNYGSSFFPDIRVNFLS